MPRWAIAHLEYHLFLLPQLFAMPQELRPFWSKFFKFNTRFGLLLLLIVCIPRFLLVLQANVSGRYGMIGLIMLVSALAPFIFQTRYGRERSGIRSTNRYGWLFLSMLVGIAFSGFLYVLGTGIYGSTDLNWYQYIGRSYNIPPGISESNKRTLFIMVASTGMIFSPIGEEFYFRGIVHSAFANSLGERRSSFIDSIAFALVHLSHFGINYVNGSWSFSVVPALAWISSMFFASRLFFYCKQRCQSLWGAIICHAGFNLGMIYAIFYLL